jgi:hypothetical protein
VPHGYETLRAALSKVTSWLKQPGYRERSIDGGFDREFDWNPSLGELQARLSDATEDVRISEAERGSDAEKRIRQRIQTARVLKLVEIAAVARDGMPRPADHAKVHGDLVRLQQQLTMSAATP